MSRLSEAIHRRDQLRLLWQIFTWPEYYLDWVYWVDYLKGNKN